MALVLYRSDDTTELDGFTLTNVEAGADSDAVEVHAWNESGTTAVNPLLVMRTVDPGDPGVLLSTGAPPQDEQWGRLRIIGYDNTGDTTWSVQDTDWVAVGSYAPGPLVASIPDGCAVFYEFLIHPPSSAEVGPWTWSLVPIYNEYSQPLPPALTRVDRGILTGVGDPAHNGIVSGCAVTVNGPADDKIDVAAGFWVHKGNFYGKVATEHTLNQNDSAAAALASGQHYWAVVSLGAGSATVTKGVKGASATKPSVPAGEVFVRYVRVNYQAGGTSVIESADLDGTTSYDRYLAVAGSGLNLTIHSGQAHGGSTWRYAGASQSVLLTDATTNYIWQLASGLFTDTTTPVAPETTAIGPLWKVVTAAGAITTITDWRTYAGETVVLHVRGNLPGSAGDIESIVVPYDHIFCEQIIYRISDNGGTAGSTKLDIEKNGTTVYTNSATDDQRPNFAHDAVTLTDSDGVHEVTEWRKGDVVTLASVLHPSAGAAPVWAEAYLICRKAA